MIEGLLSKQKAWAGNKTKLGLALFNSKVIGRMMISTQASTACVLSFLYLSSSLHQGGQRETAKINELKKRFVF